MRVIFTLYELTPPLQLGGLHLLVEAFCTKPKLPQNHQTLLVVQSAVKLENRYCHLHNLWLLCYLVRACTVQNFKNSLCRLLTPLRKSSEGNKHLAFFSSVEDLYLFIYLLFIRIFNFQS